MTSRVAPRVASRSAASRLIRPATGPAPLAAAAVSRPFTSSPASRIPLSSPPGGDRPQPKAMLEDENGFGFIRHNTRDPKPRKKSVTEIRGPYYSVMGRRYLQDVLETMGHYVDGLKFAGGSFSLLPEEKLKELIDLAHQHDVYVSTGGWIEQILTESDPHAAVDRYLETYKRLGFDVIELSTGFLSLPSDDWLRLVERSDPSRVVDLARRFVEEAGVERVMIESEGITENVESWRTDVMFEAADPAVFNWYVRKFGTDVNLFVDHSQIVQLSALRAGILGMADTFGKVASFR
ncbi:sulfonate biosynthesis enzyme [Colletotrichum musicola]|uniref:Sulfonate biosynthesis enzyme n=1 Tax=Colletotrichum musicola TaxID=2175873 RepID=A0A8H6IPR8_9PEZI|nr:sulfonate biosynthesis enzyme [Colletotrichum musicola]